VVVREQAAQRGGEDGEALRDKGGAAHECSLLLRVMLVYAHEICTRQRAFGCLHRFGSLTPADKLLHGAQFRASESSVLVGFGERSLNVGVSPGGQLNSSVDGQASRLDALDEVVLAVSEKIDDSRNVGTVHPELFGDRRGLIVLSVEALDFAQEIRRARGSSSEIFYQAHEVTLVLGGVVDDGVNHRVAEVADGFQAALPADQIVACPIVLKCALVNRDRLFKSDAGDTRLDGAEFDLVAGSRVNDADFHDRNENGI